MTPRDQFIQSEMAKIARPGEQVLNTAFMVKTPPMIVQMILAGGLLQFLLTKAYYAVMTNQRVVLIRTSMGLFKPGMVNKGVESFELNTVAQVKTGGFLNNKSMTFKKQDGSLTLRIAPWSKLVSGQKAFLAEVPQRINTRSLPAQATA